MDTLDSDFAAAFCHDASLLASAQTSTTETTDRCPLSTSLREVVKSHDDLPQLIAAMASTMAEHLAPLAVVYHEHDPERQCLGIGKCYLGSLEEAAITQDELSRVGLLAIEQNETYNERLTSAGLETAASLVEKPSGGPDILTVVTAPGVALNSAAVELAAVHLAWWFSRRAKKLAELEASSSAAIQELLEFTESCENSALACRTLVTKLQAHFGCERVAIALPSRVGQRCRLRAISGVKSFDKHAAPAKAMELALDEVILRGELTVWPPESSDDRAGTLAHQELAQVAKAQCMISAPLRQANGEVVGAWLFLGKTKDLNTTCVLNFLRAAETRIATCLSLHQRSQRGPIATWVRQFWKRRRRSNLIALFVLLAGLVGLLAMPADYRIRCDCKIEPVTRRFAAAPYDGIIQESYVTAGATVERDEPLVRMDDREIVLELATLRAERDRASKKIDSAFANRKFAAAQIARLELARLESKLELLQQRQRDLIVRSPINGIVTSGDLDQAQGAPVTRGETLFEVAPLDRMVVEVAISERDIPYAQSGQPVAVKFESRPGDRYEGTVASIDPRAEIRDQQNVFIARVILANPEHRLRPGMQGTAKIQGPRRFLAWNLFHKPWDSLCMAFGW